MNVFTIASFTKLLEMWTSVNCKQGTCKELKSPKIQLRFFGKPVWLRRVKLQFSTEDSTGHVTHMWLSVNQGVETSQQRSRGMGGT